MASDSDMSCVESIGLQFGPLLYRIIGYHAFGREVVRQLRFHLGDTGPGAPPQRVLHVFGCPPTEEHRVSLVTGTLPSPAPAGIRDSFPGSGWDVGTDGMGGCIWQHPACREVLWTHLDCPSPRPPKFHLPWTCLLEDILGLGGALIHSALIARGEMAFLLAAKAGGGKTTACGRLPPPWEVLADDAALVWPDATGAPWASPLPTWGYMAHGNPLPATLNRFRVASRRRIAGLALIQKAELFGMRTVSPLMAAKAMHSHCCEHPAVFESRSRFLESIFRSACALCRAAPAWRIDMDLTTDFWNHVGRGAATHAVCA